MNCKVLWTDGNQQGGQILKELFMPMKASDGAWYRKINEYFKVKNLIKGREERNNYPGEVPKVYSHFYENE